MNTATANTHVRSLQACLVGAVLAALALVCAMAFAPGVQKANATVEFHDTCEWVVAPTEGSDVTGMAFMSFCDPEVDELMFLEDAKITNVKSSNKKVAKARKTEYDFIEVEYGQKCGSTTISCVVNGVKLSHKFTVKYTCPVKTFKVAGKSVLKTFKKKNNFITKKTLKKKKVQIKCKSGWVITELSTINSGKYKTKAIKNKKSLTAKISTKWPLDGMQVRFKNLTTEEEQVLTYKKYYDTRYAQAG